MPKLITHFELAKELELMIGDSEEYLLLISPYFKLNDSLKNILSRHRSKEKFDLIIVYGKNEEDKRKSLSDDDLEFFKSFQNVEIRYHKRLHAKIYVNEEKCLITSMNLHDHSLKENIEVGILTKSKSLDLLTGLVSNSLDVQALEFAEEVIEKSTLEFKKEIKKEKRFFGLITTNKKSEVTVNKSRTGYCIRTKETIPLNIKHPYSNFAYHSWSQYKNGDYKEKYCHGCGINHSSSMKHPLCTKCYKDHIEN